MSLRHSTYKDSMNRLGAFTGLAGPNVVEFGEGGGGGADPWSEEYYGGPHSMVFNSIGWIIVCLVPFLFGTCA